MSEEDKKLLLIDSCGRLPHGVKIKYYYKRKDNTIDGDRELSFSDVETLKYSIKYPQDDWCEIFWKPYLRPMSSMTEEEKNEYNRAADKDLDRLAEKVRRKLINNEELDNTLTPYYSHLDWLNANHFDYRGLIEKGLALEAPEGMYNFK